MDRAAAIAVRTVADELEGAPEMEKVIFACFGAVSRDAHKAVLESLG